MATVPSEIRDFLKSYPPEVRDLALAARTLVLNVAPDAVEQVHRPWKVISYGAGKKFCAIAPHAARVNLQFHAGAALEDPASLLEGTGKSMRHVKLNAPRDIASAALRKLVKAAVAAGG